MRGISGQLSGYVLIILFVLTIFASTYTAPPAVNLEGYATAPASLLSDDFVAIANDLSILDSSDYILVKQDRSGVFNSDFAISSFPDDSVTQMVLPDGSFVSVADSDEGMITVFESVPGETTYFDSSFEPFIHSPLSSPDVVVSSKISSELLQKSSVTDLVDVIIEFDLPEDLFVQGADSSGRVGVSAIENKRALFDEKRSVVADIFSSSGRVGASSVGSASFLGRDLELVNGVSARVDRATLEALEKSSAVKRVVEDVEVHADLYESAQEIGAMQTWQSFDSDGNSLTGVGMTIAIIDTGVDYLHADLGGCFGPGCKVIGGYDFVNNDADPMDDHFHGTHCAATAAGNGLLQGVAPDATILAYKVLNSAGSGSSSNIIAAIQASIDPNGDGDFSDHADVASMSLGSPGGTPYDVMTAAVTVAIDAGVTFVIAAGNSGPSLSTIGTPGSTPSAITVAAACSPHASLSNHCSSGNPVAAFSSRGPLLYQGVDYEKPDISAPGVAICAAKLPGSPHGTCFNSQTHMAISGTSMATPHVAGAAALILQAYPEMSPADVKDLMKTTAIDMGESYDLQGAGMLDLTAAINVNRKISWSPFRLILESDPTTKMNTFSESYAIISSDSLVTSVSVGNLSLPPGITINFTSLTLLVNEVTPANFDFDVIVDNDVASTGIHKLSIPLESNGQLVGSLLFDITVDANVEITSSVDFGFDDPAVSIWTSDLFDLVLTNNRQDAAKSVTWSLADLPAGVSVTGLPSTILLNPGETKTYPVSLSVVNAGLANADYSGSLVFAEGPSLFPITVSFSKLYGLKITDVSDITPSILVLKNKNTHHKYIFFLSSPDAVLKLDSSGDTWDVFVQYAPYMTTSGSQMNKFFLKENIVHEDSIQVIVTNADDATNEAKMNITLSNGARLHATTRELFRAHTYGFTNMMFGGAVYREFVFSNFSSDTVFYRLVIDYLTTSSHFEKYAVLDSFNQGMNASRLHNYSLDNLGAIAVVVDTPTVGNLAQSVFLSYLNGMSFVTPSSLIEVPFTDVIYSNNNLDFYGGRLPLLHVVNYYRDSCSDGVLCPSMSQTPTFSFSNSTKLFKAKSWRALPYAPDTLSFIGPSFWSGFLTNEGPIFSLSDLYDTGLLTAPNFGTVEVDEVVYTLTNNSGSQVASGTIPKKMFPTTSEYPLPEPAHAVTLATLTDGVHIFDAAVMYYMKGVAYDAHVRMGFDVGAADAIPPELTSMRFLVDGEQASQLQVAKNNELIVTVNDVNTSIDSVSFAVSSDSVSFTSIPSTQDGIFYSVVIPSEHIISELMTLQVTATDTQGNFLEYTFELPAVVTLPDNYTLTTTVVGSGSIAEASSGFFCAANSNCTLVDVPFANHTFTATPQSGYSFAGWSGACSGVLNCTITFDGTKSITATFETIPLTHNVTVSFVGSGTVVSSPSGISCGSNCRTYANGTSVTFTAIPDVGNDFITWSGACFGTADTCVLSIVDSVSVSALFNLTPPAANYTLTRTVVGSGYLYYDGHSCSSSCNTSIVNGTSVTITAAPWGGRHLDSWSGACSGASSSCNFIMTGDTIVGATFVDDVPNVPAVPSYRLTVQVKNASFGTVVSSPYGINCNYSCGYNFTENTSVTLTQTPASGYAFVNWISSCSGNGSCVVLMDKAKTVYANYTPILIPSPPIDNGTGTNETNGTLPSGVINRTASVSVVGSGSIVSSVSSLNCSGACSVTVSNGSVVNLTAVPSSGHEFQEWDGSCSGTATFCSLVASSNLDTTAIFVAESTSPSSGGSGGSSGGSSSGSSSGSSGSSSYVAPPVEGIDEPTPVKEVVVPPVKDVAHEVVAEEQAPVEVAPEPAPVKEVAKPIVSDSKGFVGDKTLLRTALLAVGLLGILASGLFIHHIRAQRRVSSLMDAAVTLTENEQKYFKAKKVASKVPKTPPKK